MYKKGIIAVASILVLAAATYLFRPTPVPHLTITNYQTGQMLTTTRVDENQTFSVTFTHSVNQSPVTDIYEIQGNQIILIATEFSTFGAGIPTEPEPGQTLTQTESGTMRLGGINRAMPYVRYLVGYNTDHKVEFNGTTTYFHDLATPGQIVQFSIQMRR